jgi:hypothetical protein
MYTGWEEEPNPEGIGECSICGATGPAAELFDSAVYQKLPCGGLGVLECECAGEDNCNCHHHGWAQCPGCPDCQKQDEWEAGTNEG